MLTAADVRAGVWRHLRAPAMSAELWLAAGFVTIGTNLIDFAVVPAPGQTPGLAFIAATFLRVLLVFWIGYAATRQMTGVADPWRPRASYGRYALFGVVLVLLFGLITMLAVRLVPGERTLAGEWLTALALMAVWGILTIRLVGWSAGLALDEPFRALPQLWRGLRGASVALATVFVQVVLPFAAIHLALTLVGLRLPLSGAALAGLAVVDGVVSAVQLILTVVLGVVAWRIAREAGGLHGAGGTR